MKIYERQILSLKDFKVKLYFGLGKRFYISSGFTNFFLDLNYDKILLNMYPFDCNLNIDCDIESQEIESDSYKQAQFQFQNVKTFLGWSKICPAVITDVDQFNYLRVFEVRNTYVNNKKNGEDSVWNQTLVI